MNMARHDQEGPRGRTKQEVIMELDDVDQPCPSCGLPYCLTSQEVSLGGLCDSCIEEKEEEEKQREEE